MNDCDTCRLAERLGGVCYPHEVGRLRAENARLRSALVKIERAADRYLTHGGSVCANDLRAALALLSEGEGDPR